MAHSTPTVGPSDAAVRRVGQATLLGGFAFAVLLAFALAFAHPLAGLVPIALVLGGFGAVAAHRSSPLAPLAVAFGLFGFASSYQAGIQPVEILFALYGYSYLGVWFGLRMWAYRERILSDLRDAVFALLPAYVVVAFVLTAVNRGSMMGAVSDAMNFSMLLYYFPVREVVARYKSGPRMVALALGYLGAVAIVRNALLLQSAFSSAEYAWQVTGSRAVANEMLLLVPAVGALAMAVHERGWLRPLVLTGVSVIFAIGVILTQWRAYYVDLAVGILLIGVLAGAAGRRRLVGLGVVGLVAGGGLALVFFGDFVTLLVLGIANRILSIGTATSSDISLINRFYEWEVAWELIRANPILGYGPGVSFGFFDAIFKGTWEKSYVHNGFLLLWYKFGIFALLGIVLAWGRSIWQGWRTWRESALPHSERALAFATAIVLLSLIPSHFVQTTFSTMDTLFAFAVVNGLVAGLGQRAALVSPHGPHSPTAAASP